MKILYIAKKSQHSICDWPEVSFELRVASVTNRLLSTEALAPVANVFKYFSRLTGIFLCQGKIFWRPETDRNAEYHERVLNINLEITKEFTIMAPHTPLALITSYSFLLAVALVAVLAITLRLLALFPSHRLPPPQRRIGTPTRLLVVLGSGGHTAEMLAALRDLDPRKYTHRTYVISSGDAFSAEKAVEFEKKLELKDVAKLLGQRAGTNGQMRKCNSTLQTSTRVADAAPASTGSYDIAIVPRARRVHQSLLSTPFSALRCLWACFDILRAPSITTTVPLPKWSAAKLYNYPDLIITNGPATAVIIILASLILRFFDVKGANSRGKMRTMYLESWARVKKLSLSGKLLVRIVDRFLVQWEGLQGVGGRGEFLGVLV